MSTILFKICQNTGWVQESSRYVWKDTKKNQSITFNCWPCDWSLIKSTEHHFHSSIWGTRNNIWVAWCTFRPRIFAKGLLQLLEEHTPTPNTTGGCYAMFRQYFFFLFVVVLHESRLPLCELYIWWKVFYHSLWVASVSQAFFEIWNIFLKRSFWGVCS